MQQIKYFTSKLLTNSLVRHNLVFFVGTMIISVFNYLYYPVLSRLVSVPIFGEIQAVISLFMQLGIVLTAYGYVVTSIVANSGQVVSSSVKVTLLRLEQIMLIVSIILIPLLFIGVYFFGESFKFQSLTAMVLVGVLVLINIPSTSRTYILQGQRRLKSVSIAGSLFAVGKLLITVLLVYLPTNSVVAAVLSYILAQLVSLWYLSIKTRDDYVPAGSVLKLKELFSDRKGMQLLRQYGRYTGVIFIILSGLALLYSSDTIIARLFFDEYQAGLYSGVASVARIIFFVTASVAGVLIASVKIRNGSQVNHKILVRSLGFIILGGGLGLLAFTIFNDFFINLLVGGEYAKVSHWLPLLSVTMLLSAIANLLSIYQIAIRDYSAILSVFVGVLTLIVGLVLYVDTVEQFIHAFLVANLVVVVLLLVQIFTRRG